MDVFSDEYEDMATALYADAYPIEPDKEGRVLLPESLVAHAGLGEMVEFVGIGRIFQIWEPAAAAEYRKVARERARLRGANQPAPVAVA
jgi:MraZ protein